MLDYSVIPFRRALLERDFCPTLWRQLGLPNSSAPSLESRRPLLEGEVSRLFTKVTGRAETAPVRENLGLPRTELNFRRSSSLSNLSENDGQTLYDNRPPMRIVSNCPKTSHVQQDSKILMARYLAAQNAYMSDKAFKLSLPPSRQESLESHDVGIPAIPDVHNFALGGPQIRRSWASTSQGDWMTPTREQAGLREFAYPRREYSGEISSTESTIGLEQQADPVCPEFASTPGPSRPFKTANDTTVTDSVSNDSGESRETGVSTIPAIVSASSIDIRSSHDHNSSSLCQVASENQFLSSNRSLRGEGRLETNQPSLCGREIGRNPPMPDQTCTWEHVEVFLDTAHSKHVGNND